MAGTDTNKVTINVNGTNLEFTKIGNILGPSGKDGIDGKSIYAKTVDPWSVSGWNPAVAGDLFLNTTTGILWSAKVGAVTSNVQSNWTKVGELAGKITVDSALSSTSTNPVQNKVINDALGKKANSSHNHSSLTNSSGRIFNVPAGGSGGEQKTLVITDDLNAYQPAGNYASSTHKHPISDINDLQSTIDGIYTDMGLQDEAIAGKADSVHTHEISNINGLQSALNGKSNLDHNHDSVYQAKGDYATNDALKSYVTGTTFIDYTTYIEGEVNKKADAVHEHKISNINGLQSALDGKAGTGHTHSEYVTGTDFSAYTSWIEGEVNGKSDKRHTHSISNVDGLQSALDGKSATGHTHTISNITNLQSTIESIHSDMGLQDEAIAGKADAVHEHKISNINGLQSALDGKSNTGHTHSSIADKYNSNATTFAYSQDGLAYNSYTWLAGWNGYELRAVNKSQFATSNHTHTKSEVGLGNVDNTADANKNVNYATSAGNADTVDGNHASAFARVASHNDLTSSGNEFTFASSGFSGAIYLNWRTAGGTNGNITDYILGNGAGGQLGTIIHSGNIGSQSVNYANSAGSARASNISMSFSNGVLTITYN